MIEKKDFDKLMLSAIKEAALTRLSHLIDSPDVRVAISACEIILKLKD